MAKATSESAIRASWPFPVRQRCRSAASSAVDASVPVIASQAGSRWLTGYDVLCGPVAAGMPVAGVWFDRVCDRGRTGVVAHDRNHYEIRADGRQGVRGQPAAGGEVGQEMAGVLAGCGDQGGEQLPTAGR